MRRIILLFADWVMKKNLWIILWICSLFFGMWICSAQASNWAITVSTIERPPFVIGNSSDTITWFSIELWELIATRLDISYEYRLHTSFSDMIDSVKNKESSLAVANISITSEREEVMDFSFPIYDSWLRILVQKDAITSSSTESFFGVVWWSNILSILSVLLLLIVILLLVFTFQWKKYKSRLSIAFYSLWLWIFSYMMLEYKNIKSTNIPNYAISSYKDLEWKKIWVGKNTTMSRFLDGKSIAYIAYDDYQQSLTALESWVVDAIIADAPVAKYYANNDWKNKVMVTWKSFSPDKIAIAINKDIELLEDINTALLQIKEEWTYDILKEKWFWT